MGVVGEGDKVGVGGWSVVVAGGAVSVGTGVGVAVGSGVGVAVAVGGAVVVGGRVVITATIVGGGVSILSSPLICPAMSVPPSRMTKTAPMMTMVFFLLWNTSSKAAGVPVITFLAEPTIWLAQSRILARVSAGRARPGFHKAVWEWCSPAGCS